VCKETESGCVVTGISLPAGRLGFEHTAGGGKNFTRSKTKVKAFIKPCTKLTMQT